MSSRERAPKKSPNTSRTEIDPTGESLYVFVLRSYMKEKGISLEKAVNIFEQEIKTSPGSGAEHIEPLRQAISYLQSQLEKNKNP
ncbi:MAG: hypothetical protein AAB902_00455 [Patescibacteria group bacterium]